jgi:putative membrane protein
MSNYPAIKRLSGLMIALALTGSVSAQTRQAQTAPGTPAAPSTLAAGALSKADQKIVMDMAMANMAEVEMAKLAQMSSQNAEIKAFAQQMIDDHGKALTEVQALASSKGVTLPTALDKKHQAQLDKLGKQSGDAFDQEYRDQAAVADHKKVHAKLKEASAKAKDADVKALAAKMLPTVAQHLEHAQKLPKVGAKPPLAGK